MNQFKTIFILLGGAVLLAGSCCDECPICPTAENHYNLFAVGYGALLMSIDVPADTLIDSVSLGFAPLMLTTNSNYSKLLLPTEAETPVYDANSLQLDTILDLYGDFHFDRRHNIGLVLTPHPVPSELVKINGTTFEELGRMVIPPLNRGQIDTVNGIFYSTVYDEGRMHILYRIDYLNMSIVDSMLLQDSLGGSVVNVGNLLPIPEYNRLYFYAGATAFIYDLEQQQILKRISVFSRPVSSAQFALSRDRQKVYVSDPGDIFTGFPGSGPIQIVDVAADSVVDSLSIQVGPPYCQTMIVPVNQMRIMPDGKYLYAWCEGGTCPLLRYDLSKGVIVNAFCPPIDPSASIQTTNSFEIGGKFD